VIESGQTAENVCHDNRILLSVALLAALLTEVIGETSQFHRMCMADVCPREQTVHAL
jgi:hypothetical protein